MNREIVVLFVETCEDLIVNDQFRYAFDCSGDDWLSALHDFDK